MISRKRVELDDLIAEYLAAMDQGQAPDAVDWIARHPDHAVALASFLTNLGHFGKFLGLAASSKLDLTAPYSSSGDEEATHSRPEGNHFAEYELLGDPIGEGGMGVVYRARLVGTSLIVALKQIRSQADISTGRFHDEIEAAAGLKHPNIVPIYHVGECEGRPFFTMALVEGGSLDRHLTRYHGDAISACQLVAKVARAVHYAHQRRILHRDLKPSNILLDSTGEPIVADFGLATRLTDAGTTVNAGPPAGSLSWMAPESIRGDTTLTTAIDVWALGVILYELLTGKRPFAGQDPNKIARAILEATPLPARAVNANVHRDLEAICRRCLEKDPERRYESASAVALDLERWLRDEPVRARPASQSERFARWCRRNPGIAAGVVTLTSLLVAATVGSFNVANELEDEVVTRACLSCEYEASHVAGNVDRTLAELSRSVEITSAEFSKQPVRIDQAETLQKLKTLVQQPSHSRGTKPFVNAFLLDHHGDIQLIWPEDPKVRLLRFSGRDYFARAQRDAVHVSRVYKSENDGLDKLALSMRFQPVGETNDWVLGATVTTDKQFDLGLVSMSDREHTAILVAPRDSQPARPGSVGDDEESVILIHPAFEPKEPTVRFPMHRPGDVRPFMPNRDYRDPFAKRDALYSGRWLTGSARVGDSELTVVVQQSYDEIIRPHRSVYWRFSRWIGGALAVGLLSLTILRLLRSYRTVGIRKKS